MDRMKYAEHKVQGFTEQIGEHVVQYGEKA